MAIADLLSMKKILLFSLALIFSSTNAFALHPEDAKVIQEQMDFVKKVNPREQVRWIEMPESLISSIFSEYPNTFYNWLETNFGRNGLSGSRPIFYSLNVRGRISELNLTYSRKLNAEYEIYKKFSELEALDLRTFSQGADEDAIIFQHICSYPRLKILRWGSEEHTTLKMVESLSHCPLLEKLELGVRTRIGPLTAPFKNFARLKSFSCGSCSIDDKAVANIVQVRTLEELEISGNDFGPDALRLFAGLKNLKRLYMYGYPFDDDDVSVLAGMKQLEELRFSGRHLTYRGIEKLRSLSGLRRLEIPGARLGTLGMQILEAFVQTEILTLDESEITNEGMASIAKLKNLKELSLSRTKIEAPGLAQIGTLSNLEVLRLNGTLRLEPGSLLPLANLRNLRELFLTNAGVGDQDMEIIGNFAKLEILFINLNDRITLDGYRHLLNLRNLKDLLIKGAYDPANREFIEQLKKNNPGCKISNA